MNSQLMTDHWKASEQVCLFSVPKSIYIFYVAPNFCASLKISVHNKILFLCGRLDFWLLQRNPGQLRLFTRQIPPISLPNYKNLHIHREIILVFVSQLIPDKLIWLKIKFDQLKMVSSLNTVFLVLMQPRTASARWFSTKFSLVLHVTSFSLSASY